MAIVPTTCTTISAEPEFSPSQVRVFRPIQYLGSKLRSIDKILAVSNQLVGTQATVLDAFSGSSVVSQAFAQIGHHVRAVDYLQFCSIFANALLNIERSQYNTLESILSGFDPQYISKRRDEIFGEYIENELSALQSNDISSLLAVYKSLPQVWRLDNASTTTSDLFNRFTGNSGCTAFNEGHLITSFYAGTYFGIYQALVIDRIRITIERLFLCGDIGYWTKNVLLTALLSAVSDSVYSPGKHFAQTYNIWTNDPTKLQCSRLLRDRNIDIWTTFLERVKQVIHHSNLCGFGHQVSYGSIEDYYHVYCDDKVDIVYADPPYTAQQYSRFYHIPETLVRYQVPEMHYINGVATRGLYPINRKKSRFCSKRYAYAAFSELVQYSYARKAHLLISYSGSCSGETGNDRMISFDELLSICRSSYGIGRVVVHSMDFSYRQFNGSHNSVEGRDDKEYLIACEVS